MAHVIRNRRRQTFSQRPENFRLDPDHYLSESFRFGDLGRIPFNADLVVDSSKGQFNGIKYTSPDFVYEYHSELRRYALVGTGNSSSPTVEVQPFFSGTGPFTASFWLDVVNSGDIQFTFSQYDASGAGYIQCWFVYVNGSGQIHFHITDGSSTNVFATGTTDIRGNLHHVVCKKREDNFLEVFVDGQSERVSAAASLVDVDPTRLIYLLSESRSVRRWILGSQADTCFWARELSSDQIAVLANPDDPSLDGWVQPLRQRKTVVDLGQAPVAPSPTPWHLFSSSQ